MIDSLGTNQVDAFLEVIDRHFPYLKVWERHHNSTVAYFDPERANRVVEFVEEFTVHTKGTKLAGKPIILEEWQKAILWELFGWVRFDDGTRLYRALWLEIPRKNGKSTLCSALALYLLCCDQEKGAEIYSAAAEKEQAKIVFDAAKDMVRDSPVLSEFCIVHKDNIANPEWNSKYKALSADAHTKHGYNAHGVIVDEVHTQKNRDLIDVLKTSTGARDQPLEIYITTAGYDRNSICWEYHCDAQNIIDGKVDLEEAAMLPVIYGIADDDDWTDEAVWAKANPNLGVSIKVEYLRKECAKAKRVPAYENTFRRLHLNQWTEQDVRWMPMNEWRACHSVDITYAVPQFDKRPVAFLGIDLASTQDLGAIAIVIPQVDGSVDTYMRYFIPGQSTVQRSERDKQKIAQWVKDGLIIECKNRRTINYKMVRDEVLKIAKVCRIKEIAMDPWNATQLAEQLREDDGFEVIDMRQGFASMSAPTKELMNYVLDRKIRHNHAVLDWNIGNLVVKQDPAGNLKPDRDSSTEKIDGAVALIMAIGRASLHIKAGSVYTKRGMRTIG